MSMLLSVIAFCQTYREFLRNLTTITVCFTFGPAMGIIVALAVKWLGIIAGVELEGLGGADFRAFIVGSGVVSMVGGWITAGVWMNDAMPYH